jgi:chromosomal replication initiator protein
METLADVNRQETVTGFFSLWITGNAGARLLRFPAAQKTHRNTVDGPSVFAALADPLFFGGTCVDLWQQCVSALRSELTTAELNTWILPLQARVEADRLLVLAPNKFVQEWARQHYEARILDLCRRLRPGAFERISFEVGALERPSAARRVPAKPSAGHASDQQDSNNDRLAQRRAEANLNPEFTFETFVEGKSNQLARAASLQIGQNPGTAYNPLFIYGGVGLGKTHLMHAVGNMILEGNPDGRVAYLHSERFVAEMVRALQHNRIDEFKKTYRSVNALLIDDVQFFGGKDRSQEEFFHTFNALFESRQQIVLSSDRFPKEVVGLEERLKSRFGWGLTVAIEPPDLETSVAILHSKATLLGVALPEDVAFFVGRRIRSNIRELEGALRRLVANAQFTGKAITMEFAKDALRDMLAAQDKQVSIDNIQKTVAEYFKLRTADLLSPKRSRSIARPRQIAMALAKELTQHSLPEIGAAFGGRDHTTVLHATRKVKELRDSDAAVEEDYRNLLRTLTA